MAAAQLRGRGQVQVSPPFRQRVTWLHHWESDTLSAHIHALEDACIGAKTVNTLSSFRGQFSPEATHRPLFNHMKLTHFICTVSTGDGTWKRESVAIEKSVTGLWCWFQSQFRRAIVLAKRNHI